MNGYHLQKQRQMEEALWRSHCVKDPQFCLQSATNIHTKMDTHFMALVLYNKYNTYAISRLQTVAASVNSNDANPQFAKMHVSNVIEAVEELNQQAKGLP